MRLLTLHPPNSTQLNEVVATMRSMGPPVIRAIDCGDHYFAMEGVHRIEAARCLSIPVHLHLYAEDAKFDISGMDIEVNWEDVPNMPVAARCLVAKLRSHCNGEYEIDDEGMLTLIRAAMYVVPPL